MSTGVIKSFFYTLDMRVQIYTDIDQVKLYICNKVTYCLKPGVLASVKCMIFFNSSKAIL